MRHGTLIFSSRIKYLLLLLHQTSYLPTSLSRPPLITKPTFLYFTVSNFFLSLCLSLSVSSYFLILSGDEITTTYLQHVTMSSNRKARKKALSQYLFLCECEKCVRELGENKVKKILQRNTKSEEETEVSDSDSDSDEDY